MVKEWSISQVVSLHRKGERGCLNQLESGKPVETRWNPFEETSALKLSSRSVLVSPRCSGWHIPGAGRVCLSGCICTAAGAGGGPATPGLPSCPPGRGRQEAPLPLRCSPRSCLSPPSPLPLLSLSPTSCSTCHGRPQLSSCPHQRSSLA